MPVIIALTSGMLILTTNVEIWPTCSGRLRRRTREVTLVGRPCRDRYLHNLIEETKASTKTTSFVNGTSRMNPTNM